MSLDVLKEITNEDDLLETKMRVSVYFGIEIGILMGDLLVLICEILTEMVPFISGHRRAKSNNYKVRMCFDKITFL